MGYNWVTFAAVGFVQATDRLRNEPLWGIPPLDTRVGLRYQPQDWSWSSPPESWMTRNGSRDRSSAAAHCPTAPRVEETTPGFTVLDLRGYYRWSEGVRLVAGIENIGDLDYQEHFGITGSISRMARPAASSGPASTSTAG